MNHIAPFFLIQAIVLAILCYRVLSKLHINGPVSGYDLMLIPLLGCLLVGIVSVAVYAVYALLNNNVSFGFWPVTGAFFMPFVEFIFGSIFFFIGKGAYESAVKINDFYYNVTVAAPKTYPVQLLTLKIKNGEEYHYPFGANTILHDGLIAPDYEECPDTRFIPNKLNATWISFVDRKMYSIDVDLPYDTLLSSFKKDMRLKDIKFCFLPEGEVRIGIGSRLGSDKLLDWSAKGQECKDSQTLNNLCQIFLECNDIEEYFNRDFSELISDKNEKIDYSQDKTSLSSKVEKCMQRFNYDLLFEFEGEEFEITEYEIIYANGERCRKSSHDINPNKLSEGFPYPSRIAAIRNMKWKTSKYEYELRAYYNEKESFEMFDQNYGDDRMRKGECKITVTMKDNGCVYIETALKVDGKDDVHQGSDIFMEFYLRRKNINDPEDCSVWSNFEKRKNFYGL